jgi:hypothetical protein
MHACTVCTPLPLQVQRLRLRLRMEESARAMLQRSRLAQQLQQQNAADDCDLQEDEHDRYSAPAHGQEVCYMCIYCILHEYILTVHTDYTRPRCRTSTES